MEYGALSLPARLGILGALLQLALEGPSARAALEGRLEEAARVRKAMQEDAKVAHRSLDQQGSTPSASLYAHAAGAALFVKWGPVGGRKHRDSRNKEYKQL
jgi:hypothetical protein